MRSVLNNFFDKVYCVTVYDYFERHELVKQQLKNIDFQWSVSPPSQYLISNSHLNVSEISLLIGHVNCLVDAKLKGYDKIAIWEDDGMLTATDDQMALFFDDLTEMWDCLYMANAKWNDGLFSVKTEPYKEYSNRVFWGTGSGFNAIQSHVYDDMINFIMEMKRPLDRNYYKMFERGNSYSPNNMFFCNPISMPNERYLSKIPTLDGFISSKITHSS